jgi:hypothetical protein
METVTAPSPTPVSRAMYRSRVDFVVLQCLTAADTVARASFRAHLTALGREIQEQEGMFEERAVIDTQASSLDASEVVVEATLASEELARIGRRTDAAHLLPLLALCAIGALASLKTCQTRESFGDIVVALSDFLAELEPYITAPNRLA